MRKYKFYLKKVTDLTRQEKEQMMRLMIATYPAYKKYYQKNKYFSAVKPQMEHLIKDAKNLVGLGKLLWRKVKIGNKPIKLFAFGVLILKNYQGKGLGKQLIKKDVQEAKKRGADILYGSTSNPIAGKIVKKLGFKKLNTPVFYKDAFSGKINREKHGVYLFEFKKGLAKDIEKLEKFYIGTGPL